MREVRMSESKSRKILRVQGHLIMGYIASFLALSVAVCLMPTELLIWHLQSGSIYGHSILFWVSLVSAFVCFTRFKKGNDYFKEAFPGKLPKKSFSLFRTGLSKLLALITGVAFLVLLILFCFPVSTLPLFILFAISIFCLGLYLSLNSYEFHIYRKHLIYVNSFPPKKSQIRRDENDENHQS